MNGARIGRRGKLQGGRQGSAGQAAACPSDPFGTGLMIAGGYANGHPLAGGGSVDGNRKGGKPGVAAPRRATRAGPGRAASPLAANLAASRAAIARLHPPSKARKRPTRRRRVRPPALRAPGGEQPAAPATGKPAGARGSRGGAKAAGAGRGGNKAEGSAPRARARAVRLARARGRAATSRVRRAVPRREAMIGSRAAPARTSRAWACSVAAGVVRGAESWPALA